MDDLISRRAAIDILCSQCTVDKPETCSTIQEGTRWCEEVYTLLNLPTVQLDRLNLTIHAGPKRGRWILDGHHVRCDQCGIYMCNTDREGDPIPRFFCPNCGAKMEETR